MRAPPSAAPARHRQHGSAGPLRILPTVAIASATSHLLLDIRAELSCHRLGWALPWQLPIVVHGAANQLGCVFRCGVVHQRATDGRSAAAAAAAAHCRRCRLLLPISSPGPPCRPPAAKLSGWMLSHTWSVCARAWRWGSCCTAPPSRSSMPRRPSKSATPKWTWACTAGVAGCLAGGVLVHASMAQEHMIGGRACCRRQP